MSIIIVISIFISLILMGIRDWFFDLRKIHKCVEEIQRFYDECVLFSESNRIGKYSKDNLTYIAANYKYVSQLMLERYPKIPVLYMGDVISNMRIFHDDLLDQIRVEVISSVADYQRQYKAIRCEGWNVFNHFYRGVGLVMKMVLTYPIRMLKPDFDFESRSWKALCSIISVVGSIASIISCFINK